jgi:hypothetical protein
VLGFNLLGDGLWDVLESSLEVAINALHSFLLLLWKEKVNRIG